MNTWRLLKVDWEDCSYNLWVVNKSNYQSERRLQSSQTRYNTDWEEGMQNSVSTQILYKGRSRYFRDFSLLNVCSSSKDVLQPLILLTLFLTKNISLGHVLKWHLYSMCKYVYIYFSPHNGRCDYIYWIFITVQVTLFVFVCMCLFPSLFTVTLWLAFRLLNKHI
jgi:hypothetical protein